MLTEKLHLLLAEERAHRVNKDLMGHDADDEPLERTVDKLALPVTFPFASEEPAAAEKGYKPKPKYQ